MKKVIFSLITCLLCCIAGNGYAYSLDRNQWKQFANVNNIELFYNTSSIKVDGSNAYVWICYHYVKSDAYRLIKKQYIKGSNTTTVLKMIDYYSDGTFRRGSASVVNNVAFATNEETILSNIW